MTRARNGVPRRQRRKKILKAAKGFVNARSRAFKIANMAVERSLAYAYRDRKVRKRDFRRLWITRINAGVRQFDLSYSRFIYALKQLDIDLDRKILAELAVSNPTAFENIVKKAKEYLESESVKK